MLVGGFVERARCATGEGEVKKLSPLAYVSIRNFTTCAVLSSS